MEERKVHVLHVVLWKFNANKNAIKTAKKICSVYGQGVITDYQIQNWFSKFCSDNTSLRDTPRKECWSDLSQGGLRELVECSPCKITWKLVLDLNISQFVMSSPKKVGKVSKLRV